MSYIDKYDQDCCEQCTSCYYHWQNNDEYECPGEGKPCNEYIRSKYTESQDKK